MIVETHSLTKRYGSLPALEDCSLSVMHGEVFGLLGPNGAGKTTLIRLLMGFLQPTSGSASVNGFDCRRDSLKVRAIAAYLPGDARLFRRMRGSEVLRFFAHCRADGDFEKSKALAARLELDIRRRVAFMSTGMRQKLALAATLATNASVLILDEPTANLDPSVRSEIIKLLVEAQADGRTILLSSHVMSEIEECCDRVVILRRGKLVHTQVMDDLRQRHRISGRLPVPLVKIPESLAQNVQLVESSPVSTVNAENGAIAVIFQSQGDLTPALKWITSIGIINLRVEPFGLRSVYDRFHDSATNGGVQ